MSSYIDIFTIFFPLGMIFSMKLEEYLKTFKIPKMQFAKKIGITRQALYNLLAGAIPKPPLAKKIEEATEGRVTVMELLFPKDH